MIQEFQVSNFYSIRDPQTISFIPATDNRTLSDYTYQVRPGFKLLKLGIVYGSNASGKTTILKALDFFRALMVNRPSDKKSGIDYMPFMLDQTSREELTKMKMVFYINEVKYILTVEFSPKCIFSEELVVYLTSRPTLLYNRTYSTATNHTKIVFGSKAGVSRKSQKAIEGATINNCSVLAAVGQSNIEDSMLTKVSDYFSTQMLEMITPRLDILSYVKKVIKNDEEGKIKRFVLQILRASDFNITDLKLDEGNGLVPTDDLIFQHRGPNGNFELPEMVESAGTKRFLGMGIILSDLLTRNCFMSIDEIENSIHYELLSYFIKMFIANSEGSSQLLMTTHDLNLLDEDFVRRDVVWFADKDSDGVTSIKRLSNLGLHKTLSPYNAYRQGKLVPLPFLESIYLPLQSDGE